jgi:hypothetical protein
VKHIQAVRAFNRVWGPISDQLEMGAQADAGFDAGEWSGPANSELLGQEFFRCLDMVAARFEITGAQLHEALEMASQDNFYRTLEAQGADLMGDWHGRNE